MREPRPSENNPTVGDQHIRIGRGYVNIKRQEKMVVGQFEIAHARFLVPLEKARAFGMTAFQNKSQTDYYRKVKGVEILSAPFLMPLIDDPNLACSRPDVLRSALAWSGSRLETIAE